MLAWKAAGKASQGLPVMKQRAEHAEEGTGHEVALDGQNEVRVVS